MYRHASTEAAARSRPLRLRVVNDDAEWHSAGGELQQCALLLQPPCCCSCLSAAALCTLTPCVLLLCVQRSLRLHAEHPSVYFSW